MVDIQPRHLRHSGYVFVTLKRKATLREYPDSMSGAEQARKVGVIQIAKDLNEITITFVFGHPFCVLTDRYGAGAPKGRRS